LFFLTLGAFSFLAEEKKLLAQKRKAGDLKSKIITPRWTTKTLKFLDYAAKAKEIFKNDDIGQAFALATLDVVRAHYIIMEQCAAHDGVLGKLLPFSVYNFKEYEEQLSFFCVCIVLRLTLSLFL
jgi:hypothetical protein